MVVTLLTDFGISDPYVGIMKGVMLSINPNIQIVDITHRVSPQGVDEAAFIVKNTHTFFPKGTIHVAVVDPGVGSERAVLEVQAGGYHFLAPDNGVLKYIFEAYSDTKVIKVINRDYFLQNVSSTFHGRDVFAPLAAHIANGVSLKKLGDPFKDFIPGEIIKPLIHENKIIGEILYIDQYGNGVTNIEGRLLADRINIKIRVGAHIIKDLHHTYTDVSLQDPLALISSTGTLEISVNQGSAERLLTLKVGDRVEAHFQSI